MNQSSWLPLYVLLSSLVPGLIIFFLREEQRLLRTTLNIFAAVLKIVLIAVMAWGVFRGSTYEMTLPFLPGNGLLLRADTASLLFITLSAVLWFVTTIYAVAYLEDSPQRSQFFGFFSLCVASTMGIALAGNLLTFFFFYELLTLTTYPLVIHRGTPEALRAGDVYCGYTFTGGAFLLAGIAILYAETGNIEFTIGGALHGDILEKRTTLITAFTLMMTGLGVKAAMVPLHGWLPMAMVAPAPVSALLHAVAVVKAGAFGIARVVHDVFGVYVVEDLGVMRPLAAVAATTIIYGSLRALTQDDLKRRLAYSTVSQVSYITLGIALFGQEATVGGMVHLVHQGLMKITLFFCAGNFAEELGLHRVSQLRGIGKRMPLTMAAFTIAALGMIGLPPTAGFITKWHLGGGAVSAGAPWVIGVLLLSGALNAAYFLPILHAGWFQRAESPWPQPVRHHRETSLALLLPAVATAFLSIAVGAFASSRMSPLGWCKLIVEREFRP